MELEEVLVFSKSGFFVFPCAEKQKVPIADCHWMVEATNSASRIKEWFIDHDDQAKLFNWAVNCGLSGLAVIDVDVKNGAKGKESLMKLELEYERLPDTYTAITPSGGLHIYLSGTVASGTNKLGQEYPGIDIKSMRGYVLLPGSYVDDGKVKGYYKSNPAMTEMKKNNIGSSNNNSTIDLGDEIAPAPPWLINKIGKNQPKDKETRIPLVEQDKQIYIDRVTDYLQQTNQIAIQGQGGDSTTYAVACRCRDLGCSEQMTLELMLEHWYPRCNPSNNPGFVETKVRNAFRYARTAPGSGTAEAIFEEVIETGEEAIDNHERRIRDSSFRFLSVSEMREKLKPPEYVVDRFIEHETTTIFFGQSGNYKSFLAIDIGLRVATGLTFASQPVKQGPVLYIAGEGHGGISRRIEAWFKDNNIKHDHEVPFFVSSSAAHLDTSYNTNPLIKAVSEVSKKHEDISLVIIDTLAANFGGADENSTRDMINFLNIINTNIRDRLRCAVLVIHHTGHSAKDRPRGAYALMAGVDAHFLIEKGNAGTVCLRSPGKMKDGEPPPDTWFQIKSVQLDLVGDNKVYTSLALAHLPDHAPPRSAKGLGKNQLFIMNCLEQCNQLSTDELRDHFKSWKKESGGKFYRQTFHDAVKALEKTKRIQKVGDKYEINSNANYLEGVSVNRQ